MITLKYTVRSVHTEQARVEAMLDGRPVSVMADRLVLELADADGAAHLARLPVVPAAEMDAQRAAFAVGATVSVTLVPEPMPVAVPVPAPVAAPVAIGIPMTMI